MINSFVFNLLSKWGMILFLFAWMFPITAHAQQMNFNGKDFIRVFDAAGNKIGKGKLTAGSASFLELSQGKKSVSVPVDRIASIKTGRSMGHNILVGLGAGSLIGGVWFAADKNTGWWGSRGEGFVGGVIVGAVPGAVGGALTLPFKKVNSFPVDRDPDRLLEFLKHMK